MKKNYIRRKIFIVLSTCILLLMVGLTFAEGKWIFWEISIDEKRQSGFDDICFVDRNNGWIVGPAYGDKRLILRTSDGGKTWQRQSPEGKWTQFLFASRGCYFIDSQNGWIVGDKNLILHTSTGGLLWLTQDSGLESLNVLGIKKPIDLYKVHFSDKDNGWAVGFFGTIIHTENGGLTWERQSSGTNEILRDIHCADKNMCWAVGGRGTILHTTTGGKKWLGIIGGWQKQESNTGVHLEDVYFLDKNKGWAVGGDEIISTGNGGKTWETRAKGLVKHLNGIHFINHKEGWAVGMNNILHTTDGGKTWQIEQIGTQWLYKVQFIDENTGWIIGGNGTILRYVGEN